MRYLAKNLISIIKLLHSSLRTKGGILGKLLKFFLAGFFFMLVTWVLFGEGMTLWELVLLPIQILSKSSGG